MPETVAVVSVRVRLTEAAAEEETDAAAELADAAAEEMDAAAEVGIDVVGREMMTGVMGETVTAPVGGVAKAE